MIFSSLLYFHLVLKATPTPTHSGLMQKMKVGVSQQRRSERRLHTQKNVFIKKSFVLYLHVFTCQAPFVGPAEGPERICTEAFPLMLPLFFLVTQLETGTG